MKIIARLLAAIVFVVLFGFALKNTQEVVLRFFWDYELRGPLILLLLAFFAAGGALGILAMTPLTFRQSRRLSKKRQQIASMQEDQDAKQRVRMQQPPADGMSNT